MNTQQYTHPGFPGYTYTFVTLDDDERHEWFDYVSRGPGRVVIRETPHMDDWTEYDLDDPAPTSIELRLIRNGWRA